MTGQTGIGSHGLGTELTDPEGLLKEVWRTCSLIFLQMKVRRRGDEFVGGQHSFPVGDLEVSNVVGEGQLVSVPCPHP